MIIEYEPALKKWVVYKKDGALLVDIFKGSKKECDAFIRKAKKNERKIKTKVKTNKTKIA